MMNMFMRFDEAYQGAPYIKSLKCYSVAMLGDKDRNDVDKGGKIILPASALEQLTRLHIEYPMLFKLVNKSKNRTSHCGVLEFIAEEGRCHLPFWMMRNLLVNEGELIQVEYVRLPVAKFTKFQPQSTDFLEITNPKAVLENALRNFACLTKDDMISINYNDKDYELLVLETKPNDAVSIIECDMDVDFAPPVGYEEPNYKAGTSGGKQGAGGAQQQQQQQSAQAVGYRLDGKSSTSSSRKRNELSTSSMTASDATAAASSSSSAASAGGVTEERGKPFYDYRFGLVRFHHNFDEFENDMDVDADEKSKQPEPPKGHKLKHIGVKQN